MKNCLPKIDLEIIADRTGENNFLKVNTYLFRAHYEDGSESKIFTVDSVDRKNLDAAVIIPYFKHKGKINVYLRSSLRPAVALKEVRNGNKIERLSTGVLWEFPAGIIEPDEKPIQTAQRELKEELGFDIGLQCFKALGQSSYPCVGLCGEELFYYMVKVKPSSRKEPTLDGSVMENKAVITTFALNQCFTLLKTGQLKDAKTEVGLYRLAKYFNG